jgi:TonB family protein
MNYLFFLLVLVLLGGSSFAQSGRKAPKTIPQPSPPVEEIKPPAAKAPEAAPVTAERNEDYRCTDDGSLARIIDKNEAEQIFSAKAVDVRAVITDKPRPSYTKEASRAGVQGYVILKVELTFTGEIGRVHVVRRLPYGLTENAIRVACKIKFKPAIKDGQQVSQWVSIDYAFRLADSSIYRR